MKKTYQKPKVRIEKFSLAQTVAQSCGYVHGGAQEGQPTYRDKSSCGWDDGYGTVHWPTKPACQCETSPDLEIGEVCYNNPNGGFSIFAS